VENEVIAEIINIPTNIILEIAYMIGINTYIALTKAFEQDVTRFLVDMTIWIIFILSTVMAVIKGIFKDTKSEKSE
jgi:hypothetical protein